MDNPIGHPEYSETGMVICGTPVNPETQVKAMVFCLNVSSSFAEVDINGAITGAVGIRKTEFSLKISSILLQTD